jgi:TetR/AcrR family transcriptional regulator, transcriptional repressor for nem operon
MVDYEYNSHKRRYGAFDMGHSLRDKRATHERIVRVAAKRFRERGIEGIGVADVMKEAGVTVGGFYKHFESRDELVVEALATAFKDLDVWEEHAESLPQLLRDYLTEAHRDAPGSGCAMGALLGDMTRGSKSARTVYSERVKRTLAFTSALLPSSPPSDKRGRALLILSALLGAINLSRAVSDPTLSREILHDVREQLIELVKRGPTTTKS